MWKKTHYLKNLSACQWSLLTYLGVHTLEDNGCAVNCRTELSVAKKILGQIRDFSQRVQFCSYTSTALQERWRFLNINCNSLSYTVEKNHCMQIIALLKAVVLKYDLKISKLMSKKKNTLHAMNIKKVIFHYIVW